MMHMYRKIIRSLRFSLAIATIGLSIGGTGAVAHADQPVPSNVVVVVIDTLRADHVGSYGYHRDTTPNLDRLAERGVRFERCYSTSSWTLPSCVSLMSGLFTPAHGAQTWTSSIDATLPWLPQLLQQHGYHTMGVSSNPFLVSDRGFARGFDDFDDKSVFAAAEWSFPLLESRFKAMVLASTSATATRRALELLNDRPQDQPFFLFLHYMDPHADYLPPAPWDEHFDPDYDGEITGHAQSKNFPTDLPERDLEHVIALYDGEIAHTDAHLGKVIEHLEALGLSDDTLIVVTSDHGEAFLEHGQWFHGHDLYEPTVQVPLVAHWPGRLAEGHTVTEPVSLVDVAPTMLDLLGMEAPETMQGVSLKGALRGGEAPADRPLLLETRLSQPLRAIVVGDQKLIARMQADREESQIAEPRLFDLVDNPHEDAAAALVDGPAHAAMVALLATVFDRMSRIELAVRPDVRNMELDDVQLERLRSLGYIAE